MRQILLFSLAKIVEKSHQKHQQLCCIDILSPAQLLSFYNLMLFNEIRVNINA
jgi:hypothetical protein